MAKSHPSAASPSPSGCPRPSTRRRAPWQRQQSGGAGARTLHRRSAWCLLRRYYYNYYWFFDLDELLAASETIEPRPYGYGRWSVPFDDGGRHHIIGGTFDPARTTLYLSLENAGRVGITVVRR